MKMGQKTNSKGLAARILGEQPTTDQKTLVSLMLLALLLWPIGFFVSIFFWDAPIRSSIDKICRWGATLTIWLYPIYLFPLIRLWFKLSKKVGKTRLFYLCPLIPVAVFYLFLALASSAYAERKHEGYDPSTYKRLNKTYALDVNHAYYRNKILEGADPSTFKVLSDDYATDMHHVWFNGNIIEGAEPATFVVPDGDISGLADALAHDAHDYYMGDQPLHVANMGGFRRIDSNWALDSLQVYYRGTYGPAYKKAVPVGDYRTFKALNESYAVDAKCVYYENRILPGANPKTFVIFPSHYVHEDEDRYYVLNNNSDTEYSHDGNHVYYRDSLMSDADIASFICGYDFVADQSFAFDKNRYYQGTPNPRIEKLRQGKSQVGK